MKRISEWRRSVVTFGYQRNKENENKTIPQHKLHLHIQQQAPLKLLATTGEFIYIFVLSTNYCLYLLQDAQHWHHNGNHEQYCQLQPLPQTSTETSDDNRLCFQVEGFRWAVLQFFFLVLTISLFSSMDDAPLVPKRFRSMPLHASSS